MKKDNYCKAADEIIKAAKELLCPSCNHWILERPDFRRAKKLIIQMLKTNFVAKKKFI